MRAQSGRKVGADSHTEHRPEANQNRTKNAPDSCDKTATKVRQKTEEKIVAKQADAAADNAAIAQRIRAKLLKKLEAEIDGLPDVLGSETAKEMSRIDRATGKRVAEYKRWRLRDLTAAYKDLTADMDLSGDKNDDRLEEFLEGMKHA